MPISMAVTIIWRIQFLTDSSEPRRSMSDCAQYCSLTDYDGDGCRDMDEDDNDDATSISDAYDDWCQNGVIGFTGAHLINFLLQMAVETH